MPRFALLPSQPASRRQHQKALKRKMMIMIYYIQESSTTKALLLLELVKGSLFHLVAIVLVGKQVSSTMIFTKPYLLTASLRNTNNPKYSSNFFFKNVRHIFKSTEAAVKSEHEGERKLFSKCSTHTSRSNKKCEKKLLLLVVL